MLSNFLIGVAIVLLVMAILDVVFEDKQHTFTLFFIDIWLKIDVIQQWCSRFLPKLRRWHIELYVAGIASALFLWAIFALNIVSAATFTITLAGAALAAVMVRYMLGARNLLRYLLRVLISLAVLFALSFLLVRFMGLDISEHYPLNDIGIRRDISSMGLVVVPLWCWSLTALPLLIVYGVLTILWILELLTRSIASYSKGPLLALSAILGGVAGVVKELF